MKPRFHVKIASPCPQDWNKMRGDETKRFCESCQLHVHNLSAMSDSERQDFLASKQTRKCGIYFHAHKPPRATRFKRLLVSVTAALPLLFSACAMVEKHSPTAKCALDTSSGQKQVKPVENDGKTFTTIGVIVEERPLWKRILWPF